MEVEGAGLWLRLATCCAWIAGLFAFLTFVSVIVDMNNLLEATEGHSQIRFGGWCLTHLGVSNR
jgi:hypothetical protein